MSVITWLWNQFLVRILVFYLDDHTLSFFLIEASSFLPVSLCYLVQVCFHISLYCFPQRAGKLNLKIIRSKVYEVKSKIVRTFAITYLQTRVQIIFDFPSYFISNFFYLNAECFSRSSSYFYSIVIHSKTSIY